MSTSRHRLVVLALLPASALLAACGGDEGEPPTAAATPAEVLIEDSRFELVVPAGTEVTFTNLDRATHTVTSSEGSAAEFDSGDLGEGDEFRQRFAEPGTYDYFCEVHPTMRSTVVVE
jgi:plastocyanin